jgi:mRNA interferase YafQ
MLTLKTTAQFRKDYKLLKKRGYNMDLLEEVLQALLEEKPLAEKHRDHALVGNYTGFRECHILPDWLLIYQIDSGMLLLVASRTVTHSDLFKK